MPVYLPETENDIIKRNGRNDKLIHVMRKQQQQQQLINSTTVGHFPRSYYHSQSQSQSQSRHHYRTSNQQQMTSNNSSNIPQFHISIPQLNLEVQPMHHQHHQSLQQPTITASTLTAYSSSSSSITSPSSTNPMVRHLSSSSSLNHLHNNHNHNHNHNHNQNHNKAVSRITTTTTTTTTTVAGHLMDNHDKHSLNTLIAPDAYLQQSETQPAMLQMNEFDDDDITPGGVVEPSVHSIVDGNTNALILKPTIVNTTTTTTTTINNNNNSNNDNNHVRRQPTSKTWISPFPSRRENLYFFMFSYKVMACPYRRNCSEKVICELFHHDGEKRRHPGMGPKFLYLEEACQQVKPIGSSKWLPATRCANGDQCQYSHTILEQMYHPNIYKTSMCMNYTNPAGNRCKWGYYCTHAHGQHDIRPPANRRSNLNLNVSVNVNVNVNANADSNVNGNVGTVAQTTNGQQQIVCGNDVDKEGTTVPLTEIRSPSAEEGPKRTIATTTTTTVTATRNSMFKDNGSTKKKGLETKQQEEGLELKEGSEEGRKSLQTIGQSTTAVVEEFDNVAYTKAMKQSEKAYYFLWQEQSQQRSTLPSTAYEHYYFSNGPQCSPYLTENHHHHTMPLHPTHGGNSDEAFPFWKNEISPSPTGLNMGLGMGLGMSSVGASADIAMLWSERDNEPDFLGHLSRPAVQGGGIGLCDTDSDDEFVGNFPINIPLTSTPLAQQEEPISGEDVLTK